MHNSLALADVDLVDPFDQVQRFFFLKSCFLGIDFGGLADLLLRKKLLRFSAARSTWTQISPVHLSHGLLLSGFF